MKGFWEKDIFLTFTHEKTTFRWSKVVSEAIFVFRSGLKFLFRALEVPEPRVRKRPLSPTNRAFSSLSVRALRPFLNTNIPLNSGKYCFRNHFWPPESRFLMSKSEKNAFLSKPFNGPILIFWNLILYTFLCTKIKKLPWAIFFLLMHV